MSVTGLAYILLKACEVSDTQLIQLLAPLQGRFPNDDQEFQILKTQLRRMGHILEHSPGNIAAALRGRNAQPQYLATKGDASNVDAQSAYVAYGDTGYGRVKVQILVGATGVITTPFPVATMGRTLIKLSLQSLSRTVPPIVTQHRLLV